MSDANQVIVRRMVEECQSAGDLGLIEEFFAPGFVNHAEVPGVPNDRDGVRMLFGAFHAAFDGFHVVIHDQVADGDKVVTRKTLHGTHRGEFMGIPPTGKTVAFDVIDILRLEEGQIVEHWNLVDQHGLMQQLEAAPSG